jgi:dCMP deaminase
MCVKSSPERQKEFDIAYMKMAMAMGELSYAIRKQVGSIIVSKNDQVISQGFNGTPIGFPNVCEYYVDQDGNHINLDHYKPIEIRNLYLPEQLKTKDEVLHSEANSISKCAKYMTSTEGGTLYVTLSPCVNCAKLIIQAEIKRVVYLEDYRDDSGINLLKKFGVEVVKLNF